MNRLANIVVLVSGSGSNLQAIIDQCESGQILGKVVAVISNKPNVYALERAKKHNIPSMLIDHNAFDSRESFDAELAKYIDHYQPDLIVLAGFMRILSREFVVKYLGKMLNIHPSLLPKYPGLHTHKRALENNDKTHGASIHFVTPELDGGPVVLQSVIEVKNDDTVDELQERVAQTEWMIYPLVVKWFCLGALKMSQEQVWFSKEVVNNLTNLQRFYLKTTLNDEYTCQIIINTNGAKYDEESSVKLN